MDTEGIELPGLEGILLVRFGSLLPGEYYFADGWTVMDGKKVPMIFQNHGVTTKKPDGPEIICRPAPGYIFERQDAMYGGHFLPYKKAEKPIVRRIEFTAGTENQLQSILRGVEYIKMTYGVDVQIVSEQGSVDIASAP